MKGAGGNKLMLFKEVFELEPHLSNVQTTASHVVLTRLRVKALVHLLLK